MVALEDAFQTRMDERAFSGRATSAQLRALVEQASTGERAAAEPLEFPAWNRSMAARAVRRVSLPRLDPAARARVRLGPRGRAASTWRDSKGRSSSRPITRATWTRRSSWRRCRGAGATALAPAMAKEFFTAHFFPEGTRADASARHQR